MEIDGELLAGRLVTVASGMPAHRDGSAIAIGNRHAAFHVARLAPGDTVDLPDAPYLHLFTARGEVSIEEGSDLRTGDAARINDAGGLWVTATAPAEILVWEMHASAA